VAAAIASLTLIVLADEGRYANGQDETGNYIYHSVAAVAVNRAPMKAGHIMVAGAGLLAHALLTIPRTSPILGLCLLSRFWVGVRIGPCWIKEVIKSLAWRMVMVVGALKYLSAPIRDAALIREHGYAHSCRKPGVRRSNRW